MHRLSAELNPTMSHPAMPNLTEEESPASCAGWRPLARTGLMLRTLPRAVLACGLVCLLASPALAQDGPFPAYPGIKGDGTFPHGPGFYISITKLCFYLAVFWAWVYTTTWVSNDAKDKHHDHEKWNLICFGPFFLMMLLTLVIPWFWLSLPLLIAAWFAPLYVYIRMRNEGLSTDQMVLTADHMRWVMANMFTKGKAKEQKSGDDLLPVKFKPKGGATDRDDRANLIKARQFESYKKSSALLADAIKDRCDYILFDVTAEQVAFRRQIDGQWEAEEPFDRETGDDYLAVYKTLANLNVAERRARQEGKFEGDPGGKRKFTFHITTQGTKTGERALIRFDDGGKKYEAIESLGMREKMQEQLKELLVSKQGVVLFSALPASGLTSTINASLGAVDRFTRSWVAVEDAGKPEKKVENVQIKTFNGAGGETPATILPKLIREYPDCYVIRDVPDVDTLNLIVGDLIAADGHLVVSSIKARDAADALVRFASLPGANPAAVAPVMLGVLNQRLVRKLCEKCKEGFEPTPQMLQRLGLPAGKVPALYRQHQVDPEDKKDFCPECGNRGYKGRIAVYELMVCTPEVQSALASGGGVDAVRAAARQTGTRTMQEEGIFLVAKGLTSLEELKRVMQEGQNV